MKITIDIPELDILNEAQNELDSIDQQLTALIQVIAQGKQAEPGQSFAQQLQQLLAKANIVKHVPTDDTQSYVERYTHSLTTNTAIRCLRPQQQQLATQLKQLQRKLAQALPQDDLTEGRWHKELHTRLGNEGTAQLTDSIRAQVEQQLTEQLNALDEVQA